MHLKSVAITSATLLVVFGFAVSRGVSSSPTPSSQDTVGQLRAQVAELTIRVEHLERASDSYYQAVAETPPAGSAPSAGRRSMVVDSIEQSDYKSDHSEEIKQRRREIQSLERTIASQRKRIASLEGTRSGGVRSRNTSAQLSAQRRLLNQYQRELTSKQQVLQRWERAADALTQIVVGHDGDTLIFLHAEVDISAALGTIRVGDVVTWRGRRIEMEQHSESWLVERIRRATP